MSTTSSLVTAEVKPETPLTHELAEVFSELPKKVQRAIMDRAMKEFEPVQHLMPDAAHTTAVKYRIYAIVAAEHYTPTEPE